MANKVYRVIICIGRKRNVIFESKKFDPTDGCADYKAFKEAVRARKQYCNGNNAGRAEIFLYSK